MRSAPPLRPSGLARPDGPPPAPEERRPRRPAPLPGGPAGVGPLPAGPTAGRSPAAPPLLGIRPPSARPAAAPAEGREVVAMDPRISARRIAVRRAEGRKRLHRLAWLGGVVGVAVVAALATRTPLLDVDHIAVAGAGDATAAQVTDALAAAGLDRGDPLADVDLGGARRALESLPGVTEAHLHRRWPGTVEVDLVERVPVAAVAVAGGAALVGADGVVVAVGDPATAGVVTVTGPPDLVAGDRFDAPGLLAVAADLPEQLRGVVAIVTPAVDDDEAVELHLVGGGVVRLGETDQLPTKLVAAATVLTQVDTSCLAVLDVRVPSSPAVTREPGC